MSTPVALDASPVNILRSLRGPIVDVRLAYPEVLHVVISDEAGGVWRLVIEDADWTPREPDEIVGRAVERATIDEVTGGLRCELSDGSNLAIVPARQEADDDPPSWELITPRGLILEFGPGVRWRIGSAEESSLP